MLDLIIIGSGPAGLSAAVYAGRANLNYLVVEKEYLGTGQISDSNCVDNYLGFYDISGYDLGEKFREHAQKSGAQFLEEEVSEIVKEGKVWKVKFDSGEEKKTKTIIFAGGCKNRSLGIENEQKFNGRGISYCAVCDGAFFKDKDVAVVGGGDTALDDALYLSDICKTVYLIHRRDEFRGSAKTLEKLKSRENVVIKTKASVQEISGDKKLEKIVLSNGEILDIEGLFLAIGMLPQTEILGKLNVLDENGYVIADENCVSAAEGFFVAGDARSKRLRQVSTAVADGANAVYSVMEYLNS